LIALKLTLPTDRFGSTCATRPVTDHLRQLPAKSGSPSHRIRFPKADGRCLRYAYEMTRAARAWLGFLVAPAVPAILLYVWGHLKGYGHDSVLGPLILAPFAYASALVFGVPAYLLLTRKGIRGLGSYVGTGALIGLVCAVAFKLSEAASGWNWTPGHEYSLSLARYSGPDIAIAVIYAAIASAGFWVITVRKS
jgi:hypothetical protein